MMFYSPFIMNNVCFGLIAGHLDRDVRHIDFLFGFSTLLEPLLIGILDLLVLLAEGTNMELNLMKVSLTIEYRRGWPEVSFR